MSKLFLNDEETAIMENLKDYPQEQKLRILQQSGESETDPISQRVLRDLFLKLSKAKP